MKLSKKEVIEYINCMLLSDIKQMHLNFSEKITIIFEIAMIFFHLHDKGYVYHDLKPNNIIINDEFNVLRVVLIDLDRLIEYSIFINNIKKRKEIYDL